MAIVSGRYETKPFPGNVQDISTIYADPEGRFEIRDRTGIGLSRLVQMDSYSAAEAFVQGRFAIDGDIGAAINFFMSRRRSGIHSLLLTCVAHVYRMFLRFRPKSLAAEDIRFHYDVSNEFYEQFLDSRMQYSAADFSDCHSSLEEAQRRKLEGICTALNLNARDRFLDIGCGWGGLVTYAAEHYGVNAVGCTLSPHQFEFAANGLKSRGIEERVSVRRMDYRELTGRYNRIASVGMFEHVGRARLPEYFAHVRSLLEEGGLFLNRGIVRPEDASDGPETLFIQTRVFPGGELTHLSDVIREAGKARLKTLRMKDSRLDYARTCKAWVTRLQENADACRSLVGESIYRTWLLYLAASSAAFEAGTIDAAEVVFTTS